MGSELGSAVCALQHARVTLHSTQLSRSPSVVFSAGAMVAPEAGRNCCKPGVCLKVVVTLLLSSCPSQAKATHLLWGASGPQCPSAPWLLARPLPCEEEVDRQTCLSRVHSKIFFLWVRVGQSKDRGYLSPQPGKKLSQRPLLPSG